MSTLPLPDFFPPALAARPYLVAYDIPDNRRRTRLHRLLRGFGDPLQKSVFLCWLDAARHRRLENVLVAFRAAGKGGERIDCIAARDEWTHAASDAWVLE